MKFDKYGDLKTSLTLLFTFTMFDIIIVEYFWYVIRINELKAQKVEYHLFIDLYQIAFFAFLIPLIIKYACRSNRAKAISILFTYGFVLDVLYIILNPYRNFPDHYYWSWGIITKEIVFSIAAINFSLGLWLGLSDFRNASSKFEILKPKEVTYFV